MKTIFGILLIGFALFISFAAAADSPDFRGTYKGTYYPIDKPGPPQDMTLSIDDKGGNAAFYNIKRGTRKVAPIASAIAEENAIVLNITHNSSGEARQATYRVILSGTNITGPAFGGMVNLNRVYHLACPVDLEVKNIVVPC